MSVVRPKRHVSEVTAPGNVESRDVADPLAPPKKPLPVTRLDALRSRIAGHRRAFAQIAELAKATSELDRVGDTVQVQANLLKILQITQSGVEADPE